MTPERIKAEEIYQKYYTSETDLYIVNLFNALAYTRVASDKENAGATQIPEREIIEAQTKYLAESDPKRALETAARLFSLPEGNSYFGWLRANAIDLLRVPSVTSLLFDQLESTSLRRCPLAMNLYETMDIDVSLLMPDSINQPALYNLAATANLIVKRSARFAPAAAATQPLHDLAYARLSEPAVKRLIKLYDGTGIPSLQSLYDSLSRRFWTKSKQT